jgi:hypothetical protein
MSTRNPVGRPKTKPRPVKPEFLEMPVLSGDSIGDACRRAVKQAAAKHTKVRFIFQGIPLEANEDDDEWEIANHWFKNRPKS